MRALALACLLTACCSARELPPRTPPPTATTTPVVAAPVAPAPTPTLSPCDVARRRNEEVAAEATEHTLDERVAVVQRFAADASAQCSATGGGAWAVLLTEATTEPESTTTRMRFRLAFVDDSGEVHLGADTLQIEHDPEMAGDGTIRIEHTADTIGDGTAEAFVRFDEQYYEDSTHLELVLTYANGAVTSTRLSLESSDENEGQ